MIEIKCIKDDMGNEYLPHFADTILFSEEDQYNLSKRQEKLIMLYDAITKAENYWFLNKPTAFGNPDFSLYTGIVNGMIAGLDWNYDEKDGWIIIKSGKRTIMKIQKPKKSQDYWDAKREIAELMKDFGL